MELLVAQGALLLGTGRSRMPQLSERWRAQLQVRGRLGMGQAEKGARRGGACCCLTAECTADCC